MKTKAVYSPVSGSDIRDKFHIRDKFISRFRYSGSQKSETTPKIFSIYLFKIGNKKKVLNFEILKK